MPRPLPAVLAVLAALAPAAVAPAATVEVDPSTTRAIAGHAELDRTRYLNLCDPGTAFDRRMQDGPDVYETLIGEYGASFGRRLGLVKWAARNAQEDPARPGFVDYASIENELRPQPSSDRMQRDLGPSLGVALHGKHNAYPAFMGRVEAGEPDGHGTVQFLPENLAASAELAATVLERGYTDLDRPGFYEPVNEPHWRFMQNDHLARWHVAVKDEVHARTPDVKVGGPCMSVSYFYREGYKSFTSIKTFMEQTGGAMDFYSFHVYDYFRWEDAADDSGGGDYRGAIQTGLPLEGVLDLVQNHAVNTLGREIDVVVSEHGGYNGFPKGGAFDGEPQAERLVAKHHPGAEGFDREMKKRSIVNSLMIGSVMANTLTFMDHPHVVQKAVPFILPTTWNWGPKYYAQLYVPYDYTDTSRWVPTHLLDFYRFFRGVDGRRVKTLCDDPDVQARAFVDGTALYLVLNNQSYRPESVELSGLAGAVGQRVTLRRLGRNADFTGFYHERSVDTPAELELAGRESVLIVAELPGDASAEAQRVDERVFYADRITQPLATATFTFSAPTDTTIDYAQLRIGLERPVDAAKSPAVTLNGTALDVPLEDCADRMTNDKQYATTKLIPVDPALLKAENTVVVSFADGDAGHVGTVVLRAAVVVD